MLVYEVRYLPEEALQSADLLAAWSPHGCCTTKEAALAQAARLQDSRPELQAVGIWAYERREEAPNVHLFVEVKRAHLETGERMNPCRCPITLALEEAAGGLLTSWLVGSATASGQVANQPTVVYVGELPDEAQEFIRAFDAGERVEPIAFYFAGKRVE